MRYNTSGANCYVEPGAGTLDYFYKWMDRARDYTIMMLRRPISSHRHASMEEAMIANALKKVFVLKLPRDREPMEIDEILPWEGSGRF
jgi:hypothetical protein